MLIQSLLMLLLLLMLLQWLQSCRAPPLAGHALAAEECALAAQCEDDAGSNRSILAANLAKVSAEGQQLDSAEESQAAQAVSAAQHCLSAALESLG